MFDKNQLSPPFVVLIILPHSPDIHPVFWLTKKTEFILFNKLFFCMNQLFPPFSVLSIKLSVPIIHPVLGPVKKIERKSIPPCIDVLVSKLFQFIPESVVLRNVEPEPIVHPVFSFLK